MKSDKALCIGGLVLLVALVTGRIFWVQSGRRTIPGDGPVKKIDIDKQWITVHPQSGARLTDFIDMGVFADFKPGMTFEGVENLAGRPNNVRSDQNNTCYEYYRPRSRVEICREEYAKGDDAVEVAWVLSAFPNNIGYSQLLAPQVAKHIDPLAEQTGVTILNQRGDVAVFVDIRGRRVDSATWDR